VFDFPLVVTVLLCVGPPQPHPGNVDGRGNGLFEDALTHHAIGINGIAITLVGFLAASLGFASMWSNSASA